MIKDWRQHTDKYFTYTRQILEAENIDPWVVYQVFLRKGGKVGGMGSAIHFIRTHGHLESVNGRIYALKDGQRYKVSEPIMYIEGPLQLLVELETIYLGMLSRGCEWYANKKDVVIDDTITQRMERIVSLAGDRPVYYFGARHANFTDGW